MKCSNNSCNEQLEAGADFCPFCGSDQVNNSSAESQPTLAASWQNPSTSFTTTPTFQVPLQGNPTPPLNYTDEVLVMRAADSIWDITEPERGVRFGMRRPLLIVKEEVEYLENTDKHLGPEDLLERVNSKIQQLQVPVDVRLMPTRWMNDLDEVRPRLVAFLRNHSYADIKMIMGVDYIGKWACFQLHLGAELEVIPPPPPPPAKDPPIVAILLTIIGFAILIGGTTSRNGGVLIAIGLIMIILAIIVFVRQGQSQLEKEAAAKLRWRVEQELRARERDADRLSRTFKVDDMRLFYIAMTKVFQAVVDDIVERGGGVIRVEGGRGKFFEASASERQVSTAPRTTDAAAAGI